MKTHFKPGAAGFTLVELIVTITIIVLLSGLIVGGFAFVQDKQAQSKAQLQVALLSKGIEEYRYDNGVYPTAQNPNPVETAQVRQNINALFQRLYRDGVTDENARIYLAELDPDNNSQGWITDINGTKYITDPWGREYRYRPGRLTDGSLNPNAMNPDFDLWSSGKDGRTQPGSTGTPYDVENADNLDDIRNF